MTRRPGVGLTVTRPADGGEPPNQYLPTITAEVRVFWPPGTTGCEVMSTLAEAVGLVALQVRQWHEEHPQ